LRLIYGVHVDFEALVLESGEESVTSIGVAFANLGVEEARIDESFGDELLAGQERLALEAAGVSNFPPFPRGR
jgi:hypothetical protein